MKALEDELERAELEIAAAFDRWWSAGETAEGIIERVEEMIATERELDSRHKALHMYYLADSLDVGVTSPK